MILTDCRRAPVRKIYREYDIRGIMELHLVEKTSDSITIKIKDTDTTLITPLLDRLNADKNVKIVRYVDKHPELEQPVLIVQTIKGKPEDAIKKAAASIAEYFSTVKA